MHGKEVIGSRWTVVRISGTSATVLLTIPDAGIHTQSKRSETIETANAGEGTTAIPSLTLRVSNEWKSSGEAVNNSSTGWLIVGHGTRNEAGRGEFTEVVRLVTEQAGVPVEACFLELAEPTIEQGLAALAARGVKDLLVLPVLLFSAGHAKQDVPDAVALAATSLGLNVVGQSAALDRHESMLKLSQQRFQEQVLPVDKKSIFLLVGRGSSDPAGIAAVQAYSADLSVRIGIRGETAFVAAANPALPEKLSELGASGATHVVVLPHILFQGEVLSTIASEVAKVRQRFPVTTWLLAAHLGPDLLVADALIARAREVAQCDEPTP